MDATRTPYTIGGKVVCSDGECGELARVVIDPVARRVTHLVVSPYHLEDTTHLVPVDLVDPDPAAGEITLRCDTAAFEALAGAEETEYLPDSGEGLGYTAGQAHWLPYYPLGGGLVAVTTAGTEDMEAHGAPEPQLVGYERVPAGEVQVRRGQPVIALDGPIGRVRGLVVDPRDNAVTHVLLDEGHLWGKQEITIPVTRVADVADGIRLSLTKDEVRELPLVEIGQHG